MSVQAPAWKVSLHGGHSGEFCEHARATLREVLEAAVAAGYHTFGVSEHAPRTEARFLYPTELEKGYDLARLASDFENYGCAIGPLAEEFAARLVVLRGFEAEVIPSAGYRDTMLEIRERHRFDYMVGSVHYVDEMSIDGPKEDYERAIREQGSLEALAIRYYRILARMVDDLAPEVVGHFDLIRLHAGSYGPVDTAPIRQAARAALETIRRRGSILDLNTAGYRKGLGAPYPAPWVVDLARDMGIGFCFGDDSHGPSDVGAGVEQARQYLLDLGVSTVTVLAREDGAVVKKVVALQ